MRGHVNHRNFVGMSVLRASDVGGDGSSSGGASGGHIIACGSEDALVHTYHTARPQPLATWRLAPAAATPSRSGSGSDEAVVPVRSSGGRTRPPQAFKAGRGAGRVPAGAAGSSDAPARREFVSSVAWAPFGAAAAAAPLLAVAASNGELRVLSLQSGAAA